MTTDEPNYMTKEESRKHGAPGSALRCYHCGTYGARFLPGTALILCPYHKAKYEAEMIRLKQIVEPRE